MTYRYQGQHKCDRCQRGRHCLYYPELKNKWLCALCARNLGKDGSSEGLADLAKMTAKVKKGDS